MPESILEFFIKEQRTIKQLNFDTPSKKDFEIINIVSNSINNANRPKLIDITLDEAKNCALNSMNLLSIYNKGLNDIKFFKDECADEYTYSTAIMNRYNKKTNKILNKKARIGGIIVPNKITQLSPIWLGHELIHTLKDTNYLEFKSVYNEVIPLFYEIVMSNEILPSEHNNWKSARQYLFYCSRKMYDLSKKKYEETKEEIYKYMMDSYGKYFLDYYYAVNLYSIYKDNPKKVTKYINSVLKNRMTTFNLLNKLNLNTLNHNTVDNYVLQHQKI